MRDVDRTIRSPRAPARDGRAPGDRPSCTGDHNYLRQFPVNALKIDRSFVSDIGSDGAEGKIAAAIVGMAHSLAGRWSPRRGERGPTRLPGRTAAISCRAS